MQRFPRSQALRSADPGRHVWFVPEHVGDETPSLDAIRLVRVRTLAYHRRHLRLLLAKDARRELRIDFAVRSERDSRPRFIIAACNVPNGSRPYR